MVKPILRMPGSKQQMFKYLLPHFEIDDPKIAFIDVFGGTGIVGVSVKDLNGSKEVVINDFDGLLPALSDRKIVNNMVRYNGIGGITKAAKERFNKRVNNGFWKRVDIYKGLLETIILLSCDYHEICHNLNLTTPINKCIFYLDPPYIIKGPKLYKNSIDQIKFLEFVNRLAKIAYKVVISYSKHDWLMNVYSDNWHIQEIERRKVSTNNGQKTIELIITNK